jgi:hypothetical protein
MLKGKEMGERKVIKERRFLKIFIRAVMGSVSSYLVEHCPCPVLVVKLEHDEIEDRKELNANKSSHLQHVFGRLIVI